jgi:hypothetical protein
LAIQVLTDIEAANVSDDEKTMTTMPQSLLLFSYLQVLDVMSTVAFLMLGVHEANPLVRFAFSIGASPIAGLLLVKLAAILIGVYCGVMGRERVLMRANLLFALLVAWNLLAVIVGAARIA